LGEALLALYALIAAAVAWRTGNLYAIPFMFLYAGGFGLTAWLGLWQARGRWRGGRSPERLRHRASQGEARVDFRQS
jgi:hypothetical protein